MENNELITKFYTAFSEGNSEDMIACYHDDVVFNDPVFGKLEGNRAHKMWEMLLSSNAGGAEISFNGIEANTESGEANWIAKYQYGPKKRDVVNNVHANFKFKDGKIIAHTDTFDLYKWTKQAMGPVGYILGWTPFMKNKIQKITNGRLDEFINN